MTKAEIVAEIANKTGIEKVAAQAVVESFMETVKETMANGENVYLRGFGSFIVKRRAEKTGRNISKNTTIIIPAHNIPAFKPAKTFVNEVKNKVKQFNLQIFTIMPNGKKRKRHKMATHKRKKRLRKNRHKKKQRYFLNADNTVQPGCTVLSYFYTSPLKKVCS